jgi:hypothetical protein
MTVRLEAVTFTSGEGETQPGAEPYDLVEGVNVPMLVLYGTEDERAPIADNASDA